MSRQRAKGTRWETELLDDLQDVFPYHTVTRAGTTLGCNDAGDYIGTPYPVEAKSTKVPHFLQWVRVLRAKAQQSPRWALFWHGDRRTADGQGIMLVDADFGMELLAVHARNVLQMESHLGGEG